MSRGETFDQVRSLSLCLRRVRAKIISGSKSLRGGRKEGRKRGKKVIITLYYEGGRF